MMKLPRLFLAPLYLAAIALTPLAYGQDDPELETPPMLPGTAAPAAEGGAKPGMAKKEKKPFVPEITSSRPGATKVRLFILSGQSNMHGLKAAESFTPKVVAEFPQDDVVVVKDAQSGQPIRRWLKDWKPAEGVEAYAKAKGEGDLYVRLRQSIATAMEGKSEPVSIVFVWMQGESDAKAKFSADNYDKSLQDLIALLRMDMKAPKMPVVLGKLSDYSQPKAMPEWATVIAKQEAVSKADPLVSLVGTDDLNGLNNGLHYTGKGYKELGQRFADAAITLLRANE